MVRYLALCVLLQAALAVKVKVVMHSAETEDSKIEDEDTRVESWPRKKEATTLPFLKSHSKTRMEEKEYEREEKVEEKPAEKPPHQIHPNEMIFPLIYKQNHINSMFKVGANWYTWSTEKRTDGTRGTNYYICYDEPKHCDDVGWERTDTVPKCAFQIDSLLPEDRACINNFGIEPHNTNGLCDGGEQMKVSDMVHACGPRIRSLWRFFRVGRRPANAQKPADVNSLICEDEEECYITIEYRIHHDRITFSLHEPTRGQTFKSALKRDALEEEKPSTEPPAVVRHKPKKKQDEDQQQPIKTKRFRTHVRSKVVEGKGVTKDENEVYRKPSKNKIKVREDTSDDMSE